MGILEIISGVMLIACSVVMTLLVLAQQPKGGMGAIGGGDMFQDMSSRSQDAKIANVTKYAGAAFFVIAVLVNAINVFAK
ncbi:MAG: preprotein translocase subunit SecG [Oscillospiraceae bacterium]|mgnify:FL=1|nr:preprotein translocase subunit SecG [Oscillospiraceae bacterium]